MCKKTKTAVLVAVSAVMLGGVSVPDAEAQVRLQRGDGSQTVAPSEMPQQPTLKQLILDRSGETRGLDTKIVDFPGIVDPPQDARVGAENEAQQPVGTESGGLVIPPGLGSETRIGPVEPISARDRMIYASAIIFQFLALVLWAVVFYREKWINDRRANAGHLIEVGHRESLVRSGAHRSV